MADVRAIDRLKRVVARWIQDHRILIGLVLLYTAFAGLAAGQVGQTADPFVYGGLFIPSVLFYVAGFLCVRALYVMVTIRPRNLFHVLGQDIAERINLELVVGGLLLVGLISIELSVFQSMKMMVSVFKPFAYDDLFSRIDRSVHFGWYPHELLQIILGFPFVTFVINVCYNIWLFLLLGVLSWQIFNRTQPVARMRFLITFMLGWSVIGSLAAVVLSSAGPVYFDRVTGLVGPYGDLMAYLEAVNETFPIWALGTQELLWTTHLERGPAMGAGISAMPSMHVAMAVLMYLIAREHSVKAGRAALVYALVIMAGSVHLGWHYAIDGYVSAGMMLLLWRLSAPLARWSLNSAWMTDRSGLEPTGSV